MEAEYTDLKSKCEALIQENNQPQKPFAYAVAAKAEADNQHKIGELESQVATLKQENDYLKSHSSPSESLPMDVEPDDELKTQLANSETQIATLRSQVENQRKRIETLNSKLAVGPNSWFELRLKTARRKDRTLVNRPHARFEEVVADIKNSHANQIRCEAYVST